MFILKHTTYEESPEILGIFSIYSGLYNYAKSFAENRYCEEVQEENESENELSFVGVESNVITLFEIIEAPFQPEFISARIIRKD